MPDKTRMLRAQIQNNPSSVLIDALTEMHENRPSAEDLQQAAKKAPLMYMKAIRQLAEPLIPKQVHSTHTEVNASDLLAEMRSRGLLDDASMAVLSKSVGANVIDGDATEVPGEGSDDQGTDGGEG